MASVTLSCWLCYCECTGPSELAKETWRSEGSCAPNRRQAWKHENENKTWTFVSVECDCWNRTCVRGVNDRSKYPHLPTIMPANWLSPHLNWCAWLNLPNVIRLKPIYFWRHCFENRLGKITETMLHLMTIPSEQNQTISGQPFAFFKPVASNCPCKYMGITESVLQHYIA